MRKDFWSKVDLRSLRYFIAVADAGSFRRAAERLNVAQSNLSRQMIGLEEALGHRLFVRRARQVEITDAGQIFRREANFITSRLDRLPERLNSIASESRGSVCVGFTVSGSFHPLIALVIKTAARRESQLSLNFCVEARGSLLDAVVDRRVHACFVFPPATLSPEIRVDYLANEPILAAVHARHRLAGHAEVDLSDLAGEPFVLWERIPAPEIYDDIITACQKAGFSPRVISHVPEPISALLLTSAGVAVTLVPASLCSAHTGEVNFIPLANRTLNTSLALITRTDEHMIGVGLLRKHALAVAGGHS